MGQYGPGVVGGEVVKGYRDEEGIDATSVTPTFVALKVTIDNWRWAGVPFYLRTGKRMTRKLSEVVVRFKPTPHFMFDTGRPTERGTLTFRLQPEEGILQTLVLKQPGPDIKLTRATMKLLYADAFGIEAPPGPYAWLLLDAIRGNQTLFARADWVYEAWKTVDQVIRFHEERPAVDYPIDPAGTWGPAAADSLLIEDGRKWYVE
jgi:glucose-6-phosphate 1-dehydrogenase